MTGPFGDRSPYEVIEQSRLYPPGECPRSPFGTFIAGVHVGIVSVLRWREEENRGTPEP